jgi:hypothetical protein
LPNFFRLLPVDKMMHGVKTEFTPIIEGHRLYCNFVKTNEALNGKAPSEEAGIAIESGNKWLALTRKAVQYQKTQVG